MTRQPGEPTQRQLYARDTYLQLGPGRSLARCLEALKREGQIAGRPPVCTRIKTLERWCRDGEWTIAAIQYDAEQAARRSEMLAEQERAQVKQDIRTLAGVIRGCVGVSAVIVNSYVDQQGNLVRDGDLHDVAALLKVCLQALNVVHPGHAPHEPPRYAIQQLLSRGEPEQRQRALQAMRQLDSVLSEFESGAT